MVMHYSVVLRSVRVASPLRAPNRETITTAVNVYTKVTFVTKWLEMFSFWSNDEDENSENSNESDGEKDKSKQLFCGLLKPVFLFKSSFCFSWKTRAISLC
jgi:hypothetical protein